MSPYDVGSQIINKTGKIAEIKKIGNEIIYSSTIGEGDFSIVEINPYETQLLPKFGNKPLMTWLKKRKWNYDILDDKNDNIGKSHPIRK